MKTKYSKMETNHCKNIKTDQEMVKLYEAIIKQEKERGRTCSWRESTRILAFIVNRINNSVGIKEFK